MTSEVGTIAGSDLEPLPGAVVRHRGTSLEAGQLPVKWLVSVKKTHRKVAVTSCWFGLKHPVVVGGPRIFGRHSLEVVDERLLDHTDMRVVLDGGVTGVPLDGCRGLLARAARRRAFAGRTPDEHAHALPSPSGPSFTGASAPFGGHLLGLR